MDPQFFDNGIGLPNNNDLPHSTQTPTMDQSFFDYGDSLPNNGGQLHFAQASNIDQLFFDHGIGLPHDKGKQNVIQPTIQTGVQFLTKFLPYFDTVAFRPPLQQFLHSNFMLLVNDSSPLDAYGLQHLLSYRERLLLGFSRQVTKSWECLNPTYDGSPDQHTVLFESKTVSQFKNDPLQETLGSVFGRELNILDLVRVPGSEFGFVIIQMRTYKDPKLFNDRKDMVPNPAYTY